MGSGSFLPAFGILAILEWSGRQIPAGSLGPMGQAGHRRGLARGGRQRRGDDARAAFLLQPDRGRIARGGALGMEPTYYWDALNAEARTWLAQNTKPGETIVFATFPHSWLYLRHAGELPAKLGADRSWSTEMVCASKSAGGVFRTRAVAHHARAARLHCDQVRDPADLGFSLQRARTIRCKD